VQDALLLNNMLACLYDKYLLCDKSLYAELDNKE